jgi:uncharacterized protein DUF4436
MANVGMRHRGNHISYCGVRVAEDDERAGGFDAVGSGRRFWKRHGSFVLVITAISVVVLGAIYATGIGFYFTSSHRASTAIIKNDHVPIDDLIATAQTLSFNPNNGELAVRVRLQPIGGLVAPDAISLTRAVSVTLIGGGNTTTHRYNPGDTIGPMDVTMDVTGDANGYPLDSYSASLSLDATAAPVATNQQSPAPAVTPTLLAFRGSLSGYRVSAASLRTAPVDLNLLSVEMKIKRSLATIAFAVLILVLQALVAVAAATLAVVVVRRRRRVEPPLLTWLAALLFALIPLRNAMPGAPPIGAEVDVIVFFWAIAVITLSLLVVLAMWIRRPARASLE